MKPLAPVARLMLLLLCAWGCLLAWTEGKKKLYSFPVPCLWAELEAKIQPPWPDQPVQSSPQSWEWMVCTGAAPISDAQPAGPCLHWARHHWQPSLIASTIKRTLRKINSVPSAPMPSPWAAPGAVGTLLPRVQSSLSPVALPATPWHCPGPWCVRVGDPSKPCGETEAPLSACRAVAQKLVYSCGQACLEVKSNSIF